MKELDWSCYVVSRCELVELEWRYWLPGDSEQLLLSLLKSKGAPIDGTFVLSADTYNYTWEIKDDLVKREIVFVVRKNKEIPF